MGHVGGKHDLPVTHQFQNLGQQCIFDFGAKVEISLLDVFHRRELLDRCGARNDIGEIFRRMLKAVMQALENEVNP